MTSEDQLRSHFERPTDKRQIKAHLSDTIKVALQGIVSGLIVGVIVWAVSGSAE